MIEYIVDIETAFEHEIDLYALEPGEEIPIPNILHERVVRCRDCKHYDPHPTDSGVCFLPDGDGDFARWEVEPDGFCAWGERKTNE